MTFDQVLILNAPSPPGYCANKDSMGGFGQLFASGATIMPPVDLPYLAGFLADKGVPLAVVEGQGAALDGDGFSARVAELAGTRRTLCVIRTSAPTLDWDLALCEQIKRAAGDVAIGVYGPVVPQVTARLQREAGLDYIVRGEPDEVVWELAGGRPPEEILGLSYRVDGGWRDAPLRKFNRQLDALPFPAWELLPYRRYTLPKSSTTANVVFLPMLTSRGCPYGCDYCPYPVGQGLKWRYRSPANVVDEMEHLVRDLGVEYILFRDPMFTMRMDRVVEICEEIQRRLLRVRWKCETRFDRVDERVLRAMAAAGCEGINFGIESSDMAIQANVGRKPIAPETMIEIMTLCRQLSIKAFCFFIIGLPGDTRRTILDSIAFAIRLRPNWVQFTAATPFIGTKLRSWALDQGFVTPDEYAYVNSHEAMIGNETLSKREVAMLLRFAKFFERYLINRGGILKDDNRHNPFYGIARGAADRVSATLARALFAVGRSHLERGGLRPV